MNIIKNFLESVKEHNVIRALSNENAELKAEIAKLRSEFGKLRESEKDKEEEALVKYELNEKKKELELKRTIPYFSLKSFFAMLARNPKLRAKLAYYSFDRSTRLAKFGDIGFSADGDIVCVDDKGRVILKLRNLNDIFQSVAGLANDVKDGKIILNLDKDGNYVENIMVWEPPELIPTEDGKFKYAKARKRYLYEYLAELREKIAEQQEYIEELEMINAKLQQENDELKIAQRVAENSAETARTELSLAERRVSAIEREFRNLERELAQLRDTNAILDDNITKLEKQIEIMRKEAEREGVKLSDEKALELIQQIRRELIRDEPKEKEVHIIKEEKSEKTKKT